MKKIPLTQNQFAIVDNEDFEWLSRWKWIAAKNHYGGFAAIRKESITDKTIFMHRVIMNTPKGMDTDHKNHNTLDNKRENLRIATRAQSNQNTRKQKGCSSRYKGVYWYKDRKKWRALIRLDGKIHHLGYFISEKEAALVFQEAANKYHGEFAYKQAI